MQFTTINLRARRAAWPALWIPTDALNLLQLQNMHFLISFQALISLQANKILREQLSSL
jgi:hypothetical protein